MCPQTSNDEEEEDSFFYALEKASDTSPRSDITITLIDFSAQVVKEAVSLPTACKYILHNLMNDNGFRLIQFVVVRNMIIGSTLYPYIDFYKSTWKSPDGVTFSQIDHLLIDK